MCVEMNSLRIQSYSHAMRRVRELTGLASPLTTNIAGVPMVRALAHAGRLDTLETALQASRFLASKAGLHDAAKALATKLDELAGLEEELTAPAILTLKPGDVVALDSDFGKRGRGARIISAILASDLDATAVAQRFQLAMSTSRRYIQRARKQALQTTALAAKRQGAIASEKRLAA